MNASSSSLSDFCDARGATRMDGAGRAAATGLEANNWESGLCGRASCFDDIGRLLVTWSSSALMIRSISLSDSSSSSLKDTDSFVIVGDGGTSLITAARAGRGGAAGCSMANRRYIDAGATGCFGTGSGFCESSIVNKGGPKGSTDWETDATVELTRIFVAWSPNWFRVRDQFALISTSCCLSLVVVKIFVVDTLTSWSRCNWSNRSICRTEIEFVNRNITRHSPVVHVHRTRLEKVAWNWTSAWHQPSVHPMYCRNIARLFPSVHHWRRSSHVALLSENRINDKPTPHLEPTVFGCWERRSIDGVEIGRVDSGCWAIRTSAREFFRRETYMREARFSWKCVLVLVTPHPLYRARYRLAVSNGLVSQRVRRDSVAEPVRPMLDSKCDVLDETPISCESFPSMAAYLSSIEACVSLVRDHVPRRFVAHVERHVDFVVDPRLQSRIRFQSKVNNWTY